MFSTGNDLIMTNVKESNSERLRKPHWLKIKLPKGSSFKEVKQIVKNNRLETICQSGNCPNLGECWGEGTATFMILGEICSRNCSFCNVNPGRPDIPDENEPERVAEAVRLMKLRHCVITSVTRDDLTDKGALIWASTIKRVYEINPGVSIEVLIPDFKGDEATLNLVLNEKPDIVSHNMETVERLYKDIRPQANYSRSLEQIRVTKLKGLTTKSGFMLGLGEKEQEVFQLIRDLHNCGLDILTIGQYLQPTPSHYEVKEYVHPDKFDEYKKFALQEGIGIVEANPLVRSSYHSERHVFK